MSAPAAARTWAIVAAAGQGRRMDAGRPKQYLPLAGATVLERAIRPLWSDARIAAVIVVLAPDDEFWPKLPMAEAPRLRTALGGATRQQSVLNGLVALAGRAAADDWVLVHDGARPCLGAEELDTLIAAVEHDSVGGLLAVPLADTLKHADASGLRSDATVDRKALWCAQTPQMFRYQLLRTALEQAVAQGLQLTDEAAAVEALGHRPRLVRGSARNLKITHREDLVLAEALLREAGIK
ncbi:MAG TPA: 2-C-methyl-D-erythritol 4-phosphate cytidylyltransferase [Steroidobacteraceae bacterium]|nr:2-C-methyl-D-erythritol 4-phosphate cytidylyltransferase [Steroidobacteraceae bacterium]